MNFLENLLTAIGTFVPSALLLWLAASLALHARRDQLAWDRHLGAWLSVSRQRESGGHWSKRRPLRPSAAQQV